MEKNNNLKTLDYFLKYITFDTQSDDNSKTTPSTFNQLVLAKEIYNDIKKLGYANTFIDEFGQVYLFIDGEKNSDTIGFCAHMDTALEESGKNVTANIISNYDGKNIILKNNKIISPNEYPILNSFIGDTLITTDGTTLLGADDKAGISIIMNLIRFLKENPSFKHHPISILFTCDEEIGRGADHFNNLIFKADYGFTIDGDTPYAISYENFNAAEVDINITGFNIHPGEAKNKMVNALLLAFQINSYLDAKAIPELTENYQGFYHLNDLSGNESRAHMHYIIRDFNQDELNNKIDAFYNAKDILLKKYKAAKIDIGVNYQYKNMAEILNKDSRAINKAKNAFDKLNISYKILPIRGGTDGATFSFKGCPTPNLGTGSYNHHGVLEFLNVNEHNLLIEILKEIVKI